MAPVNPQAVPPTQSVKGAAPSSQPDPGAHILVTGAGGQVGRELMVLLESGAWRRTTVTGLDRSQLDVSDRVAVRQAVQALRPDLVINCAARTDVDACETDPDGARSVNVDGVRWLAEACGEVGAHLTSISTDYVFDGHSRRPYTETDPTGPLSTYGRTKLEGEQAATAFGDPERVTVVRTSLVCGAHGNNAVKTILAQLSREGDIAYVTDQVACPTFAADLAQMVVRLSVTRRAGLFHAANRGAVSRFELAVAVAEVMGADTGRVNPITTDQLRPRRPAARPAYSALDNQALRAAGEPDMRHFREPLTELVDALTAR